jgi:hypothetical protein
VLFGVLLTAALGAEGTRQTMQMSATHVVWDKQRSWAGSAHRQDNPACQPCHCLQHAQMAKTAKTAWGPGMHTLAAQLKVVAAHRTAHCVACCPIPHVCNMSGVRLVQSTGAGACCQGPHGAARRCWQQYMVLLCSVHYQHVAEGSCAYPQSSCQHVCSCTLC